MTDLEQIQALKIMAQAIRIVDANKILLDLINAPSTHPFRKFIAEFEQDLDAYAALDGKSHDEGLAILQAVSRSQR